MLAEKVAQVTGEDSPNLTGSRFAIAATDLGIMWFGDGGTYITFGDTYGKGWGGYGAGPRSADWRCNVLGRCALDPSLNLRLRLTSMVQDRPGHAEQVLAGGRGRGWWREVTVIPTAGIEHGGRQWLHAMNVRKWVRPGVWTTDHATLWSSAQGEVWEPTSVRWGHPKRHWWQPDRRDGSRFQMAAFVKSPADDGWVRMFGTPAGRSGDVYLAWSEDMYNWRYWAGPPTHVSSNPGEAVPVMTGPVAELSVIYHRPTEQWVALSLDETRGAILLRTASGVGGPWQVRGPVLTNRELPGLYGAFLHPRSADGDLWFTVSEWGGYQVHLYQLLEVALR